MDVCLAHMTEIKVVVSLILGFFCCRAVVKGCNREPEISESEESNTKIPAFDTGFYTEKKIYKYKPSIPIQI